jgi:hypothetical protein
MDRKDEERDEPLSEPNRDEAEDTKGATRRPGRDTSITSGSREVQRTPGATGIDMGAGGTGTDIDRDI